MLVTHRLPPLHRHKAFIEIKGLDFFGFHSPITIYIIGFRLGYCRSPWGSSLHQTENLLKLFGKQIYQLQLLKGKTEDIYQGGGK